MARGINKVILIGNLGADPEERTTATNTTVTRITVATSESFTRRGSETKEEHTEWHRVVFFGRLAEIARDYLRKGSKVYIEGRLRTNKYNDKEGITRWSTEIIAQEMQMLDSRGEGNRSAVSSQDFEQGPTQSSDKPQPAKAGEPEPASWDEDGIPF